MDEVWKRIKGFEDSYEVSNFGNVRSIDRYIYNKANKVDQLTKGVLLKGKLTKHGYKEVCLYDSNRKKHYFLIHRLVAMTFLPNMSNKKQVNHINTIKTDNQLKNLEWSTPKENINHAMETGLMRKGSQSTTSKLKEDQVYEMRCLFKTKKYSFIELGKIFGVDASLVGRIIRGQVWRHVEIITYDFDIDSMERKRRSYKLKLTESQIEEAKKMVLNGVSISKTARYFNVSPPTISRMIKK